MALSDWVRRVCLCSYITGSRRIDHKEDTKLAVDAEEQGALIDRMQSGSAASTPSYHFICECFFLTARGLHLGFVKTVQDTYNVARVRLLLLTLNPQGKAQSASSAILQLPLRLVMGGVCSSLCPPSCASQRCQLVIVHAP